MWIKGIRLQNIRSFDDQSVSFSRGVNILVGPNNAGKSTVLLPLLSLQDGLPQLATSDMRLGIPKSKVDVSIADVEGRYLGKKFENICFELEKEHNRLTFQGQENSTSSKENVHRISNREPNNFIYPFISKRKVTGLAENVTDSIVETVSPSFDNIYAKIDRLSNSEFRPAHDLYMKACDDILGFRVATAPTGSGKRAVYTVHNMDHIPLLAMGEGVMNILGLVVHLVMAEDRLFLIEEPENDVHPRALKALLDLVVEKSTRNQFIITTHSNIVLKKLGAAQNAKILRVECEYRNRMPVSRVTELGPSVEDRKSLLSELGYEFADVGLWASWLILEESSAEKIIREYLIPWFVPSLQTRVRTFSACSLSQVSPKFRDFNDLFVFMHLEPLYRNHAWVLVDGGDLESSILTQLRQTYCPSGWAEGQFLQLKQHNFEQYYPSLFADSVTQVLGMPDKKQRHEQKIALLAKVEEWIVIDQENAKKELAVSCAEIVDILREIEKAFKSG